VSSKFSVLASGPASGSRCRERANARKNSMGSKIKTRYTPPGPALAPGRRINFEVGLTELEFRDIPYFQEAFEPLAVRLAWAVVNGNRRFSGTDTAPVYMSSAWHDRPEEHLELARAS